MGYIIEVTFNLLKQRSIDETQNEVLDVARECFCETYYIDFEMLNEYRCKRNHCVITIHYDKTNLYSMLDFLRYVKRNKKMYIETICSEDPEIKIIYASKSHLMQNNHRMSVKEYYLQKKDKKYSDEERSIINIMENK